MKEIKWQFLIFFLIFLFACDLKEDKININYVEQNRNDKNKKGLSPENQETESIKDTDVINSADLNEKNNWVVIPTATFLMGSNSGDLDEKPEHKVRMTGFKIGKYEITVSEYGNCVEKDICPSADECDNGTPNFGVETKENDPVNCVSWEMASTYCRWIGGDLPTEAEWEYAARKNLKSLFPWGNTFPDKKNNRLANCQDNSCFDSFSETAPVGSFENILSPFGIADMSGNVWEWVRDFYDEDYYKACTSSCSNPLNDSESAFKVIRGGGWDFDFAHVTLTNRQPEAPETKDAAIGFRCAIPLPE